MKEYIKSKNLLTLYKEGYALDERGNEIENVDFNLYEANVNFSDLHFILSCATTASDRNVRISQYINNNWYSQIVVSLGEQMPIVFYKSSLTNRLVVSIINTTTDLMLNTGSTAATYAPFWAEKSGRIYRNSLNLIENYIDRASIETDGTISATENYRMFYGKVESGKTYTIDENTTLCGFFENEPTMGSQSYNNQRIYQTSATFTAPITGYFCYRKLYSANTAMMNEGTSLLPYEPYNVVDWYTNNGHKRTSGAWD